MFLNRILVVIRFTGSFFLRLFKKFGRFCLFVKDVFTSCFSSQVFWGNIARCFKTIGFDSITIVGWTGFFAGCILSLQLYYGIAKFGIIDVIPNIIVIALFKELGPMLVGIMLVSRVGSSMTAEIAGMKVNNQLDILKSLSIDPFRFVFIPRVFVLAISTPILTIISCVVAIAGSYLVCVNMFGFPYFYYLELIIKDFELFYLKMTVIKSVFFGVLIALISCYKGKTTKNGAVGIGRSTISSVVTNCVFILFLDLIITYIMEN